MVTVGTHAHGCHQDGVAVILSAPRAWLAGHGRQGAGLRHRKAGSQMSILGTRVVRTEDPRLLTAGGTYVDDLRIPELEQAVRVTFIRSPIAHARVTGIDASAAKDAPGVVAVLTVADMTDLPPPPPDSGMTGTEGAPLPLGGKWS